ncbi:MAG: Type 1 glutamine amidotransferase-like domain-containing protein [Clostridia bacterium]|nr:Type 1 glutamine amidotransferase-like domain-containing protein [Clostridia bacterium]
MLILCSNGLSSQTLRDALRLRLDGCCSAALVVTADSEYKERNYHVPRCTAELETLGLTVTLFDIDTQAPAALLSFDVVEFIGGNPFDLLDAIRRTNAAPVLRQLAEEKVLIGWSAAAFVFGPTLALVNRYSPEMNTVGLTDLAALALTQTEVLPHYSRFLQRFDRFEETCRAYEQERGVQVIRLNDGDGVLLEGSRVILCRN